MGSCLGICGISGGMLDLKISIFCFFFLSFFGGGEVLMK